MASPALSATAADGVSWQRGVRASAASLCRGHFYKLVAATVAGFLLLEYSFNMLSTNQKPFKVVSPGLSWIFRPVPGGAQLPESASPYSVNKSHFDKIFPTSPRLDNTSTMPALELCPLVPPHLGANMKNLVSLQFRHMLKRLPTDCTARHRVAILVPYRDREDHLRVFLYNMHQMLPRQQIDYTIFVIEQAGQGKFNRAKLFNVGYLEALALYDYQCFIFHDVDLIPEDDRNLYTCPEQPRHMSVAIDTMKYRLPYALIFGGVSALKKEHMQLVNGFSNEYWGWGGEDDDMSYREVFAVVATQESTCLTALGRKAARPRRNSERQVRLQGEVNPVSATKPPPQASHRHQLVHGEMVATAWVATSPSLIENCFKHAGFTTTMQASRTDCASASPDEHLDKSALDGESGGSAVPLSLTNAWGELRAIDIDIPDELTIDAFARADDDVVMLEEVTDMAIIKSVRKADNTKDQEETHGFFWMRWTPFTPSSAHMTTT
ncbi:hypothetical protein HPB51_003316 [Rhipicephalus microplus]|uniref:Beta-1,4-N-acetylgalactosaminyltransferase n=1 Tax=Rhipicephalus microplus TaxID=6941 RepID=A0A9J6DFK2_RHIMP|nr:hypothetical protein HPB51_003316 [Rhipicephalus microplus]